MKGIGWHFPPTGGGQEDGYTHSGMSHFSGSPLGSLARETIQNSLDARFEGSDKAVSVTFEIRTSDASDVGRKELQGHVGKCIDEAENDKRAAQELTDAAKLLSADKIIFLRIADYHTTGLDDKHWQALVKLQGRSEKPQASSGGSFGIGKYAPFVVSRLRTVFYWSRFQASDETPIERCQGKAVLMSHDGPTGKTQGTGFYGQRKDCVSLSGQDIPESIATVEAGRDATGTSLWVAGFADTADWRTRVARSVVSNFFCAIADGELEVLIEPSDEDKPFRHWEINRDQLEKAFDGLIAEKGEEAEIGALREAQAFFKAMYSGVGVVKDREDPDLGHCRLWIHVAPEMPSKVALIRKTGMLITSEQRGLLRFHGFSDFVAVLRFESDKGNVLLRDTENPTHSQFEPGRLSSDEPRRQKAQKALDRIIKWTREEIRALATAPILETSEVVSELAHLLPDLEPDESFGERDASDGETAFGGSDVLALRPARRMANALLPDDTGDDAGNDTAQDEGSAPSGDHEGGTVGTGGDMSAPGSADNLGTAGGGRARQTVPVKDVRLLPLSRVGLAHAFAIAFTPTDDASNVRIELAEAGDSTAMKRTDLYLTTHTGDVPLSDHTVELIANQRVTLEVHSEQPIEGRAWKLSAKVG